MDQAWNYACQVVDNRVLRRETSASPASFPHEKRCLVKPRVSAITLLLAGM